MQKTVRARGLSTIFFIIIGLVIITPVPAGAATVATAELTLASKAVLPGSAYFGRITGSVQNKINELSSKPALKIPVPILLGVNVDDIPDTWGDARSGGRSHEGTDIMAPKGSLIVSPTDAVVVRTGYGPTGGTYVYTANPGGEAFYYAHLDKIAKGIEPGKVLEPGDLIGYVGNTGNAKNSPSHLHLGIFSKDAINPYPRLVKEFSTEERIESLKKILDDLDNDEDFVRNLVITHRAFFLQAREEGLELPSAILDMLGEKIEALTSVSLTSLKKTSTAEKMTLARDLKVGARGEDVRWLQEFLIQEGKGNASVALKKAGATGVFGPLTQKALAEYQASNGVSPALGYFGPKTRALIHSA